MRICRKELKTLEAFTIYAVAGMQCATSNHPMRQSCRMRHWLVTPGLAFNFNNSVEYVFQPYDRNCDYIFYQRFV